MLKPPKIALLPLLLQINLERVLKSNFAKSIEIELSDKTGEFGMFEELGDNGGFEEVGVFDDEGEAVGGPGGDLGGAGVDHVVRFCERNKFEAAPN